MQVMLMNYLLFVTSKYRHKGSYSTPKNRPSNIALTTHVNQQTQKTGFPHSLLVERKHADRFNENNAELNQLNEARNQAQSVMLNRNDRSAKSCFKHNSRLRQKRYRELKKEWGQSKATELQELADMNGVRGFHQILKAVWGPRVITQTSCFSLIEILC